MTSRQVWKHYGVYISHPADFNLSVSMVISHFKKSTLVHDAPAWKSWILLSVITKWCSFLQHISRNSCCLWYILNKDWLLNGDYSSCGCLFSWSHLHLPAFREDSIVTTAVSCHKLNFKTTIIGIHGKHLVLSGKHKIVSKHIKVKYVVQQERCQSNINIDN